MRRDDELIRGYVERYTQPVEWVWWWQEASDPGVRRRLGSILLDSEADHLRDLTGIEVRRAVVEAVLDCRPLREAVAREMEAFLEAVADRVSGAG